MALTYVYGGPVIDSVGVNAFAGSVPAEREAAVTMLFRLHGARLVGFARLLADDPAHAEDLVQDAFVGLWRRWNSLRDPEAALAYLHTSVVNGARRGGRVARLVQRVAAVGGDRAEVPDPVLSSIANEDSRRLLEAIKQLPRRQREVLVLRYYFDQPEAQIAELLSITRGSVKQHASRGLARLQQLIGVSS